MSEALKVLPVTKRQSPYTLEELSVILDNHEMRIAAIEEIKAVVDKLWNFLVKMTPIMIGALAFGANPDSPIGRVLTYLAKHLPQ